MGVEVRSETKLNRIGFPGDEDVARDAGNLLRSFLLKLVVREKSSFQNVGGLLEIRFDFDLSCFNTTGFVCPSLP